MENNSNLALSGSDAVKKLRLQNLHDGIPFMINSRDLPGKQCYMEYPDKTIKLVTVSNSGMSFDEIRILTDKESNELRQKFNLADA